MMVAVVGHRSSASAPAGEHLFFIRTYLRPGRLLLEVALAATEGDLMHKDRTMTTLERMERLHVLALPVNGSRVRMGVGDRLDIQMRQMVGSRSEWTVVGLPDGVNLERDEHFQMGARVGGAFSSRLFQFSALRETVGQIRLSLGVPGSLDVLGQVNVQVTVG